MEKDLSFKWDNSKNKSSASAIEIELKIDETYTDSLKSSILQTVSSSTTAVINPLKNTSIYTDSSLSIINVPSHSNEQSKPFSRRNTVQPLLKKPISNAPTTSIKPLILPAPTSDSFSQHPKSNIVSMHSTHPSNSISTPFNCQQPMTMGIATIQPQHFGYQNLSNNRYPMIPMSLQNNYPAQQLTLTNGGLGTTVQLMPVMNQNNNQMNNSRMQPLPLFMGPIIGSHGGMIFQPNMTIMPQNSNAVQTFNIANTSYSHDFNPCQSILSQTINPTNTLRHSIVLPAEIESYPKPESDLLNYSVNSVANISTVKEDRLMNIKLSASDTVIDPSLSIRPSVKQRGLIRTQIYRMKQSADDEGDVKRIQECSPAPVERNNTHEDRENNTDREDVALPIVEDEKIEMIDNEKSDTPLSKIATETESAPVCVSLPATLHSPISSVVNTPCNDPEKDIAPKQLCPIALPLATKRRLPSPEILDNPQPMKIARVCYEPETPSFLGRKSPGSLFEKISHVIPERKTEILDQSNRPNKLTAVVRPEQRKMLVHYLDDLIIFESDEPFPTTNKMQVVKSALRAGNIKLNPQKSKLLNDQYLFLGADEEVSPSKHRANININTKLSPNLKSASFLEPLTIDIPTTASSSCGSLDSSQVRPLSMCSYQSTLPPSTLSKMTSQDNINTEKEMPKIEKEKSFSSVQSECCKETIVSKPTQPENKRIETNTTLINDQPPPMKILSPVKPADSKRSLDSCAICDWSVSEVVEFVKQTPGCENYAGLFQNHEIDGEALLLLSKDNLIQGALNMKIGPALKLCAKIEKRKALDPH